LTFIYFFDIINAVLWRGGANVELDRKIARGKCIITISMALLLISIGLQMYRVYSIADEYTISYESVDIKSMSKAAVAQKEDKNTIINAIIHGSTDIGPITEVSLPKVEKTPTEPVVNVVTPEPQQPQVPVKQWYLPTEQGIISQNPSYSHATAIDITSPRGTGETIYPVANGVISGIYIDNYGALVVAVNHEINGIRYTSLYAHLSSYADGIYVGKPVTPFDPLGQMGTTGYSTGVHLHLVVVDCSMFDPNDGRCYDLNSFFNYTRQRQNEGFIGLGAVTYVPGNWWSR